MSDEENVKKKHEQPDERGLLPDYGCTKSGKACDRCKVRYRKFGGWRFCSDCKLEVEREMHESGYLQEIPPDYEAALSRREEEELLQRDIRRAWGDEE